MNTFKDVLSVEGVAEVRRGSGRVFVVVSTHDVARDRRIVKIMGNVDYDIVPIASADMIPENAEYIR